MELEPLNRMDPGNRPDLLRLLTAGARIAAIIIATILCLTGLYLLLDVYFTIARFIESPATLEPVLAAWDSALRGAAPAAVPAPESPSSSFLRFMNSLVTELSNGRLARPLGGFIVFLFMTVLFRVAAAVLGAGTKLLLALAAPAKASDTERDAT